MLNELKIWIAGRFLRQRKARVSWYVTHSGAGFQMMFVTATSTFEWLAVARLKYWLRIMGEALGDGVFTVRRATSPPDLLHCESHTILNGLYIQYLDAESILEASYEVPHQNLG